MNGHCDTCGRDFFKVDHVCKRKHLANPPAVRRYRLTPTGWYKRKEILTQALDLLVMEGRVEELDGQFYRLVKHGR